jgi:hypothetical protein
MNRHAVDSENGQAGLVAKAKKARQGEIAKVFVVDGVVLQAINKFSKVRHFDNNNAFRLEQLLAAG